MKSKKAGDKTNRISRGAVRLNYYLEIYIAQDGAIMITPVTNRTKPVVEKISGRPQETDNVYCG